GIETEAAPPARREHPVIARAALHVVVLGDGPETGAVLFVLPGHRILAAQSAKRVVRHAGDERFWVGEIDAIRERSRLFLGIAAGAQRISRKHFGHGQFLRRGRTLLGPQAISAATAVLMNFRCRASAGAARGSSRITASSSGALAK